MRRFTALILLCVLGACGSSEETVAVATADPTSGLEAAMPSTTFPTTTTTTTAPPPPTTARAPQKPSRGARRVEAVAKPQRAPAPVSGDVWYRLAMCETGGTMNQRATSPTGKYLGYFQFSRTTWASVGGPGDPRDHDYETQKLYAQKLQARSGWGQWPHCSSKLGLR